jgi:hypothetical protein
VAADGPARALGRPVRLASDGAGALVAGALAGIARARGGKAVHPHGVTYGGRLTVEGAPAAPEGSDLLSAPGEWPVVVRFSRSVGLPRPLPDLLGISIRVLNPYGEGRHQDLLMVTSAEPPLARHLFLPARDVQQRLYTSSLPYQAGNSTFLLAVRPDPASPRPTGGDEFDRLERAARTGLLRFDLVVASWTGPFARVGTLRVGERLSPDLDALRFSPFVTGGGLAPVGALNRWRAAAYPLSQQAWGRSGDRAAAQERADRTLDRLARAQT